MITQLEQSKVSGTNAERLAMAVTPGNFMSFYETDTNSEYEWKGSEWVQKGINGAACVTTGAAGQAHNRYMPAVATTNVPATNSCTYVGAGVTVFEFMVPTKTSFTSLLVVYGAPNDAVAAAWLSDRTGGSAVDVQYDEILPGTRFERKLSSPVIRIDMLAIGAANAITIGAV